MNFARLLTILTALSLLVGCVAEPPPVSEVTEQKQSGHERMRKTLARIATEGRVENNFVGDTHAQKLRGYLTDDQLVENLTDSKHWELLFESAQSELKLGNEELALELFGSALEFIPKDNTFLRKKTLFQKGLASMRFGETQNCCLLNSADSCIVPIRGAGIHTREAGSRSAIECFLEVLKMPAAEGDEEERLEYDESARWLLNIAYMTLGEYPAGVPEQYRIAPGFFQSDIEFPKFTNVYPRLNLNTFNLCGGAVVDDFDGDNDLDIVTCTWDITGQTQVFRNNGNGSFDEVTVDANLEGFYGGLNLVHADYDNDGDLDLYIMRGAWLGENGLHPNSLLRNDGNLKFTDVTFESGLGKLFAPTKTAEWADYDNDGDLDLYVGNETSEAVEAQCQLFRNDGNGHFKDVAREAGLADHVFSMGATWGDYNNDRYPDLYLSLDGPNKLYRNNKDGTFTNIAEEFNVETPHASFPTWFWDYDNDGRLDLFVGCTSGTVGVLDSEIRFELLHLYRNLGEEGFEDVAKEVGLHYPASPMGANFGDINQDGFPDFYLATGNVSFSEIQPNVMFLNQQGKKFVNVTMAGGFGHLQKGHAVSFADIDNDGDQDVYVQLGGAYLGDQFNDALFENPGFPNHSITLKLVGTTSNRCAIGARVQLTVTEEDGQQRTIYHHVSSGSSFGANPFRQAIGVGTATKIDRLEVTWPTSDTTQTFADVPVDQGFRITENSEKLVPLPLKAFSLPGK